MEKAKGSWPSNVTAHIVTPEEKNRLMQSGIAAKVETQVVNVPNQEVQAQMTDSDSDNDSIPGNFAIKIAKSLGLDFVWLTANQKKISLSDAQEIYKLQPDAICFDFNLLALEQEEQEANAHQNEEIETDDSYLNSDPVADPVADPVPVKEPVPQTQSHANPLELPLDERRQRAWGGTLSAPGMQVYIHPRGIVRVEVSGQVKVQKGIQNGIRVFRVERMVPITPDVTYRKPNIPLPPEKIEIPKPTENVEFDDTEF
jgi:hypothetical protein